MVDQESRICPAAAQEDNACLKIHVSEFFLFKSLCLVSVAHRIHGPMGPFVSKGSLLPDFCNPSFFLFFVFLILCFYMLSVVEDRTQIFEDKYGWYTLPLRVGV